MNVICTSCETIYRVDPAKVPASGVRARCAVCGNVFAVQPDGAGARSGSALTPAAAPAPRISVPIAPVFTPAPATPPPAPPAPAASNDPYAP